MAKIHLDRLMKKFKFSNQDVKGSNYRNLMKDILSQNSENTQRAIGRLSKSHWEGSLKRLGKKSKQFIIPDVSEVLPKRSVFIRKAAIQGDRISNSLRDKLTSNLREALKEFKTKVTDEPAFIRRRGTLAGTINPKVIQSFQEKIKETFTNYTKKDPRYGVPSNIKTIATTEIRSSINDIKEAYNSEFLKKNPNVKMDKTWIQNKHLSKKPRVGHAMVHKKTIAFDEKFDVPLYINDKFVGTTPMDRPHDSTAPLEQVVGCNCDIKYSAVIKGGE